jgi:LysR family glycine cleavage system transcriptional activator
MERFPPPRALLCLDAAMRLGSFNAAAAELCVTPGAVGQQIGKLEAWLGVALFERQVRQIRPTAEGLDYWQRVRPALTAIADASLGLRQRHSRRVGLSMPPSFAAKWLPRRLASFLTRYPEVELNLSASTALVEVGRGGIDLAIRYFDGHDSALDSTQLYRDEARVYCRADYASARALQQPADLQHATLLETTVQPHWPRWLQQFAALDDARVAALPRIHFDQALIAIEAAKQGQGVVLASPLLVEEEILLGTLIEPFGHALALSAGYHVVHPRHATLRPAAQALKEWLIEQAEPLISASAAPRPCPGA